MKKLINIFELIMTVSLAFMMSGLGCFIYYLLFWILFFDKSRPEINIIFKIFIVAIMSLFAISSFYYFLKKELLSLKKMRIYDLIKELSKENIEL